MSVKKVIAADSVTIHPVKPDRQHVDTADQDAIDHWVKHLGKSKEEIVAAIEKVGPTYAAIRKELGLDEG
jgi:pyridoxine 5'-phosphate synthase PdxJ